jgi:hypothetical protein
VLHEAAEVENGCRDQWMAVSKQGMSFPRFPAEEFVREMIGLGYRNEALTTMVEISSDEWNFWLLPSSFLFATRKRL